MAYPKAVFDPLLFRIHIISDINYEIADSSVSCYTDDTRILLGINDEEDTQMLENDLHQLYKFPDEVQCQQVRTYTALKRRGTKSTTT